MCKETILTKIKHLLNMTVENGCTEFEALSAISKARQLMLKHKVEEKDLTDKNNDVIQIELTDYNISIPWLYLLIDTFSVNFGVMKYIHQIGKIQHFVLFGLKDDVECVIELIKCAHDFAEGKASKYANEHRELFGTAKGIKYSWFNGFVLGVQAKYNEQNKQEEFALMTVINEKVKNEFEIFTQDFNKNERVIKHNVHCIYAQNDGYREGKKFGTTSLPDIK